MDSDIRSALIGPKPTIQKVAIVRALHLGDLLLAVPAWRALRAALPDAEITLVGLPWAREFVRRFSIYIDRFVEFPGYPGMLEADIDVAKTDAFLRDARAYGYDLAIQMHGDGSVSNDFVVRLGAKYTVGYRRDDRSGGGLSLSLLYPNGIREVLKHLQLMELLGVAARGSHLEFPVTESDDAELEQIPALNSLLCASTMSQRIACARPSTDALAALSTVSRQLGPVRPPLLVGIHPGARPPARRWLPKRFAAVADGIAQRYSTRTIILAGPGEESIAEMVRAHMRSPAASAAGSLTIGGLAALIGRLDLLLANDSGPAHLAEAVGTKSIVFFGPADPARWAPLDQTMNRIIYKKVDCSPCPYWECPIDHRCLQRIRSGEVLAVADALLSPGGNGVGQTREALKGG
ncbi:MAG: glycosyltransferase family 9 protein [Chloroflexi bacterium]|nr:glycosyltransferase family 9 protein [Chloroflexota bacterium]